MSLTAAFEGGEQKEPGPTYTRTKLETADRAKESLQLKMFSSTRRSATLNAYFRRLLAFSSNSPDELLHIERQSVPLFSSNPLHRYISGYPKNFLV